MRRLLTPPQPRAPHSRPRRRRAARAVATRLVLAIGVAALLLIGTTGTAAAHTELITATPGPGDTSAPGLTRIDLVFAGLNPTGPDRVELRDPTMHPLPDQTTIAGNHLTVQTAPLAAGVYQLAYTITAPDGHASVGGFYLDVVGPGTAGPPLTPILLGVIALAVLAASAPLLGSTVRRARHHTQRAPSPPHR